jgi:S1-C subfamily serine protease
MGGWGQTLMQVSGGIIGGNSGGAVYDANGGLIGVPVIAHQANEIIGFAVPLPAIKEFLKNAKADAVLATCR